MFVYYTHIYIYMYMYIYIQIDTVHGKLNIWSNMINVSDFNTYCLIGVYGWWVSEMAEPEGIETFLMGLETWLMAVTSKKLLRVVHIKNYTNTHMY